MKQKKLTVYHSDGSQESFLSRGYDENETGWAAGGITAIGYCLNLEDDSQIIVSPSLYRRIKIEEI